MRAPVFGRGAKALAELEKLIADFAAQLRTFFTVVEIEIVRRRFTTRTAYGLRDLLVEAATLNRRQGITML